MDDIDDTEFSLRKRLKLLSSYQKDCSILTTKPARSNHLPDDSGKTKNLSSDTINDSEELRVPTNLYPDDHKANDNDSSDSDLPCGIFGERVTERLQVRSNSPVPENPRPDLARDAFQPLNEQGSPQHDTSTFTLKDLRKIEIDLTSETPDNSFTRLKAVPETQCLKPVVNILSEASSSDSELPGGIFVGTLTEQVELSRKHNFPKDFEVLPSKEIGCPPVADKQRLPSELVSNKKSQAKLKAEEKEKKKKEREKEKELKKKEKERMTQIKKAQQLSRKAFQPKECLKHMSVVLDSGLLTVPGLQTVVVSVCENLGSTCLVESQQIPYVITWRRSIIECNTDQQVLTNQKDVDEDEIMVCLPLENFVELVFKEKQKQKGEFVEDLLTLQGYLENVCQTYLGYSVTIIVIGMENYFRQNKKSKKKNATVICNRLDVEESVVNVQLRNLCNCHLIDSVDDFADIVRTFTKAIAEKPMKKDRLQSEFSFHNEKGGKIALDTQSLWKAQLEQFKNISNDVSSAIVSQYPSPQALIKAYKSCGSEIESIKLLENIVVRRKAGVLETSRRVGKEASRRIYLLMSTNDPNIMLK